MRRERGEGRLGCLIVAALLIVVGFVLLRTVPVLLDQLDFEDQLERIASEGGARNWDPDNVKAQVLELARVKQFEVNRDEVQVTKAGRGAGGQLRIDIKYRRTVDFAGYYYYTFKWHSQVKSFVGTL